jgi:hypothetical protein
MTVKNTHIAAILMFFFLTSEGLSQSMRVFKTDDPIKIDGVFDEAIWNSCEVAKDFRQYFPYDSSAAIDQTEVRMTYDDQFIYVAAKMYRSGSQQYVTPSLRRDFRGAGFDVIAVILDTYKDRTNAFSFGVNPFGVQREGLIANGGSRTGGGGGSRGSVSFDWDNKWYSAARISDGYWTAEMAIPFKTIRYKEGLDSWYVNFYRTDSKIGERSTWSPIPRNFSIANIAFSKEVKWEAPLKSPGKNISLIPYTAFQSLRDFDEGLDNEAKVTVGGDAKIAVTPSLNLDLTVNPDFSQVEVDEQVTNLDRFEIFFPEKRQFFLENADLFADFGSSRARPFFSRRIGIAQDTATGQNIQNQLYFGVRLSGKIDNNWRIGAMTMQAAKDSKISLPSINYTVASIQRKLWARSNIGVIFVNKQAFQDSIGADFTTSPINYNRVAGLDFNYASEDNKWSGKLMYHQSFDQDKQDSTFSTGAELNYNTYRWEVRTRIYSIGANFNPEVGFVRRKDISQWATSIYYNFYPKKGIIQSHAPGFDWDMVGNKKYGFLDWDVNLMYRINFRNTARFSMRLRREYTYLFDSFDPSGTDGPELPADSEYRINLVMMNYRSDARNNLFFDLSTRSGQYFNGYRINLSGEASYRFQPIGVISLNFTYNGIRLAKPYNSADLFLIGPKIDLTFTRSLFWTTLIQYNSQINNVNINSRLQWRYKPVSDLFVVYTDNYLAGTDGMLVDFAKPKYRAFVIKLTYWLNI